MGGHLHAPLMSRPSGLADRYVLAGARERHEQDAHRAARHFTTADAVAPARPPIRPVTEGPIDGLVTAPPSVRHALNESGDPLESAVRGRFERHFSHDFSRVRVHTGPAAAQSAHEIGARAYTAGRDIVFGVGQYAPGTPAGRHVLAHELTHVIQQHDAVGGQAVRVQRLSLSDVLEEGAEVVAGPAAKAVVHSEKQFIDDLAASVRESPQHVMEFLDEEVWEQIRAHMWRVIGVSVGLIVAEELVAFLTALPEPTLLSKVIAAILEIIIIAVLGYFAKVEVVGAYEEGRKWLATARQAHGQPEAISAASRSFVRMVWHIVMAVLAVAGVRARLRGIPRGAGGATGSDVSTGSADSAAGGTAPGGTGTTPSNVIPFRPRVQQPAEPPPPSASAFGPDGTARQLAPAEAPQPSLAPRPAAPPAVKPSVSAARPTTAPGVQPVPAVAAGVSSAMRQRPPFVLRLPQEKAPHLTAYRANLGWLQSDPHYDRGSPAQLRKWHNAHRIGGSHGIPHEVYERGHALGLTGKAGERLIRVPNWSRTRTIPMQVDHIIELQVTPAAKRVAFDEVSNYELLDKTSNERSGDRLWRNIVAERARQVAYDPSAANRVLIFDQVELDGGQRGERWSSDEIRHGDQLDAYHSR